MFGRGQHILKMARIGGRNEDRIDFGTLSQFCSRIKSLRDIEFGGRLSCLIQIAS